MRSDYALYVVAVTCFILAVVVLAANLSPEISIITIAVLAVLGLISAGAGYLVRPEEITLTPPPHPPEPKPSAPPPTPQAKIEETPPIEITEVKGIGPKRAEQLRALGINTAQDLAKMTATTLAAKTELSPKITSKWIGEAKKLIKEAS